MVDRQSNLFGEPAQLASASQWFTPPWLAARVAQWVPRSARVIEPACGSGNLVEALLRNGHLPERILAIERDPHWANFARTRFNGIVTVLNGDFLADAHVREACERFQQTACLMNPPFEDNAHMRFILASLDLAPLVVGIFPGSIEFSGERDRRLWSQRATVSRRALLVERVDYGGDQSPSFDSVALMLERRTSERRAAEVRHVREETWRPRE